MSNRMRITLTLACIAMGLSLATPGQAQVTSGAVATPPAIDGAVASAAEWAGAGVVPMTHGTVHFLNDAATLYVLFDVTGDTIADSGPAFPADMYLVMVDVDRDGVGDEGLDVAIGPCPNFASLIGRYTLISASGCGYGATCGTSSGEAARSFGPSPASITNHRIWEVAIPLSEIAAQAGEELRLQLALFSTNPPFADITPPTPCDAPNFLTLALAGASAVPALDAWALALLALLVAAFGIVLARRVL